MNGKELMNDMIYTYFMLVTMILGVMAVLGMYFFPDAQFGYESFTAPLIYAAYGTLPNMIMYGKKEFTMKQLLVRKTIQLILVEVIIISVAIPKELIEAGRIEIVVSLAISILVIYIVTHIIEWFQNFVTAKKLTQELLIFQQNHQ